MQISQILKIVVTCFLFSAVITPVIKKIALHVGAVDIPDERKVHTKPMPRLGGLAIFCGFLLGYMLFGDRSSEMISILIGGFIIILTGIIDDIKPLPAYIKFSAQFCATLVVTLYGGILLKDINAFGFYLPFGIFSYPLTIFFFLGAINCINLIDGLDGLAARHKCNILLNNRSNCYYSKYIRWVRCMFSIYNVRFNFRLFST